MVSALLAGNFTYACLNRERIALRAVRAEKAVTQTGVTVRGKIGRKKLESIFFIIQIVFDHADFISASGGALNGLYGPGEYLFVFDGVTEIKTAQSDKGYIFSDGKAKTGLLNMTVNFSGKISAPLDPVTAEPAATSEKSAATKDEINRARETYQSYITNLEKFPSKMKIGNKEYVGFSDRDFSKLSQKAGTDEVAKSETAEIVLLHKSGLQFTLKTAFYPDYAAFDWVLYF